MGVVGVGCVLGVEVVSGDVVTISGGVVSVVVVSGMDSVVVSSGGVASVPALHLSLLKSPNA